MARSYARIITGIWRNHEFRRLSAQAQRLYLLQVTQPDITAAGILPLTLRRWAELASDTSVEDVKQALDELTAGRFIAVDEATEELLVRSFVRWDGGHTNSKRRPVILHAASEVVSPKLRRVLAFEFQRLDLPADRLGVTGSDALSDSVPGRAADTPYAEERGSPQASFPSKPPLSLVDRTSDAPPDKAWRGASASERVVVTEGSNHTTTHNPHTVPPPAVADAGSSAQRIVAAWVERCRKRPPSRVIGQISRDVKAMLGEGIAGEDVQAGLLEWQRKGLHPATLASVVHEVMNPTTNSNNPSPATTGASTARWPGSGSSRLDVASGFLSVHDPLRQKLGVPPHQPGLYAIEGGRST